MGCEDGRRRIGKTMRGAGVSGAQAGGVYPMRFPGQLEAPLDTPETAQAQRTLHWLDQWLPQALDREQRGRYQQLRHAYGPPARGRARLPFHGPVVSGVRMAIEGNGDEAHGHTRLRAIVRGIVVPLVEDGRLDRARARELQQRMRGEFPDCWGWIQRAIDEAAQRDREAGASAPPS